MFSGPQRLLIFLVFLLIAPALTFASSIEVSGVCQAGTCPLPTDTLLPGGSVPVTTFDFTAIVNGDPFDIAGEYSSYNSSNTPGGSLGMQLDVTATYEGTSPSAQDDTVILEDLQNNIVPGSFSLNGTYSESLSASFSGTLAKFTSLRGQLFVNGNGLGTIGPFSAPGSQTITMPLSLTGRVLDEDFQVVFDFGPGTNPGMSITGMTSTPEPGGIIPVAAILALCLGIPAIRRSRLVSKQAA